MCLSESNRIEGGVSVKKIFAIAIILCFSTLLLTACSNGKATIPKEQFVVGNHVSLGQFSGTNGKQPIDWMVIEVQDNRALLISHYGLISKQYNHVYKNITWENSDIRQWLNQEFYNEAFSTSEKDRILLTNVDNSKNQGFKYNDTKGGNNTKDYVFLLSYSEKAKYFSNTESAICYSINKQTSKCAWWLRSPGIYQHSAIFVRTDGSTGSKEVDLTGQYIRPALWYNFGDD